MTRSHKTDDASPSNIPRDDAPLDATASAAAKEAAYAKAAAARVSRKPVQPEAGEYLPNARQWVRLRGIAFDRAAGFLREMQYKFPRGAVKTRAEWASLWDTFQNRPV